jgi:hypothetical protein
MTSHATAYPRVHGAASINNSGAAHTRVVMIEINVPEVVTSYDGWPAAAMAQIRHNEQSDFPSGEKKPGAYVFVTNHAFHNNLTVPDAGMQVLAAGFHIPGFGQDAPHRSYKGVLEARARHVEMFALLHSMQTHYEIPSTFDGEMPELAFQGSNGLPRLQFAVRHSAARRARSAGPPL